jgi:hypothetical protein
MKMKNKRFWLRMFVIVLVFGITVVGCDIDDNGNGNGTVNGDLNGIWSRTVISTSEQPPHWQYCDNTIAILFQGGGLTPCDECIWIDETRTITFEWVHEFVINDDCSFTMSTNEIPYMKGTYSTNDGKITIKPTHTSRLNASFEEKWYDKNEIEAAYRVLLSEEYTDEQIARRVNASFSSSTSSYFVKGNALTITKEDEKQTFTRKN